MFLKIRRKTEQEAFSRYGLTYIVDEYLPTKLDRLKAKNKIMSYRFISTNGSLV